MQSILPYSIFNANANVCCVSRLYRLLMTYDSAVAPLRANANVCCVSRLYRLLMTYDSAVAPLLLPYAICNTMVLEYRMAQRALLQHRIASFSVHTNNPPAFLRCTTQQTKPGSVHEQEDGSPVMPWWCGGSLPLPWCVLEYVHVDVCVHVVTCACRVVNLGQWLLAGGWPAPRSC